MLTPEGWQFLIKMARIGASVMPRPIAEGTSVVVPLYDLQKIILTIFNGSDPLDERNGARKSYDNLRSILAASPSASTGKDGVARRHAARAYANKGEQI